jgi:hypothetical protein
VTLLASPDPNEGYTAEYDEPTKKWTLTGTGGGSDDDTQNPVPQGTKWTLTIGTDIEIEITQGATAFADGDKFEFSVFKSAASGGKQNEIDTGSVDVTDGP